jgi:hypothetical protein
MATKKMQTGGVKKQQPSYMKSQAKAEELYDNNPSLRTNTPGPMTKEQYQNAAAKAASKRGNAMLKVPAKKMGGATTKMQKGGKTGAQLKKEGLTQMGKGMRMKMEGQKSQMVGKGMKAKGEALKTIGTAKKQIGQDQFLKKAEVAQDLINYRTRKGQIQDMNPEMLAKLKSRVNRAAEIKKERVSKTYKTGGSIKKDMPKAQMGGSKPKPTSYNPSTAKKDTSTTAPTYYNPMITRKDKRIDKRNKKG